MSQGALEMIRRHNPKIDILYYHHGTSMHTKMSEEQWGRMLKSANKGLIGCNKIAFEKSADVFQTKLQADKQFVLLNAVDCPVDLKEKAERRERFRSEIGVKDEFLFCFIGRVCEQKGVLNLIKAYQSLPSQEKVKLVIIGASGTKNHLSKA